MLELILLIFRNHNNTITIFCVLLYKELQLLETRVIISIILTLLTSFYSYLQLVHLTWCVHRMLLLLLFLLQVVTAYKVVFCGWLVAHQCVLFVMCVM